MDADSQDSRSPFQKTARAFFDTSVGTRIYNLCGAVQLWAGVVGALCLVYLVLAAFSGDMARSVTDQSVAKYNWVGFALTYAVLGFAVAVTLRCLEANSLIVYLGIAGAVFFFGLPLALEWGSAQGAVKAAAGGTASTVSAMSILTGRFTFLALSLWGLGGLRGCIFVGDRFMSGSAEDKAPSQQHIIFEQAAHRTIGRNVNIRPGPLARCWEQPFCVDFIREVCKPWSVGKTCWRIQSGCMCDVAYLYDALKKDRTFGVRADEETDFLAEEARAIGGGRIERKLFCKDCRIYLEHQRRKFRLYSPLSFPVTALLVYFSYPFFQQLYRVVVGGIGRVIQAMWLSGDNATVADKFVHDMRYEGVVWAVMILFGLFLLSGVMRLIEWATLDAKL